jgi:hypothetical protein
MMKFSMLFWSVWAVVKSKWMWLLAVLLSIGAFAIPTVRESFLYLLVLFLPGLFFLWAGVSPWLNRVGEDALMGAATGALSGGLVGAVHGADKAMQPRFFERSFISLGLICLHPALAALVALVVLALTGRLSF